jgi:SAM-dependent methyltransferase
VLSHPTPSPADSLAFTGERFTPETPGEIWYEHWHRYCVVMPLAQGKRVLDAACGEGYGSALLADVAASVVGVDQSSEAIAHANARYAGKECARFICASVAKLPLPDASIDLVVSFETIEHLTEQETMLGEFRRVLTPQGLLVISSPNKPVYSDERDYHNEFHVRELTREGLAALLAPGFPRQHWYGQRLLFHSLIWSETTCANAPALETISISDGRPTPVAQPAPPMYFLVICGGPDASLPGSNLVSLFADHEQTIYREFERTTQAERKLYPMWLESERQRAEAQGRLAAQEQEIEKLKHAVALLEEELQSLARRLP